jgi:hypothetical protein
MEGQLIKNGIDFYIFLLSIAELRIIFKDNIFFLTSQYTCIYIGHTMQYSNDLFKLKHPIGLLNSPKNQERRCTPTLSKAPGCKKKTNRMPFKPLLMEENNSQQPLS